jgi:hypothetical protein
MLAYRCENRSCQVIHYRASASNAKCPACKKEGVWTGKIAKKSEKPPRKPLNYDNAKLGGTRAVPPPGDG